MSIVGYICKKQMQDNLLSSYYYHVSVWISLANDIA